MPDQMQRGPLGLFNPEAAKQQGYGRGYRIGLELGTRHKISAARRKGKWTGGYPVLGYGVGPRGGRLIGRLIVNELEATQVREIFDLYLEYRSLVAVAREVNSRGWTKRWTTKDGREHRAGR